MLRRFSLYGFLKNQQYYEPFLILAFREKGLSFFMIGILIAFREIAVNVFEVPSGAVADVWGRRRSMILSFAAYIVSFLVFGLASNMPLLFVAMLFFAVGEAFRTGTHKAMIFTWLRMHGREKERTRVYGYTRSWSKIGSALSVVLAAVFVFVSRDYVSIFYFSVIPYLLGIINFLGYPAALDGERHAGTSFACVAAHLRESLSVSFRKPSLRRLIFESMGFEGVFKAAKDYLQPILKSAALPLTAALLLTEGLQDQQKTALLVGPVYCVLYILSAVASRNAHRLVDRHGHEDRTARFLWAVNLLVFAGLLPAMWFRVYPLMIAGFLCLFVLQNLWRPVLISRFDAHSNEAQGATILSIESQAKSVSTMLCAPLLGYAVDFFSTRQAVAYWPVAVIGVVMALAFLVTSRVGVQPRTQSPDAA